MWITLRPCGKERMFVEEIDHFYQNRSHFFKFYPRFTLFSGVIHKNFPVFSLCTTRLWTSYPPYFAAFSVVLPSTPDFGKIVQVIHGALIHFLRKDKVDNPVLSTF